MTASVASTSAEFTDNHDMVTARPEINRALYDQVMTPNYAPMEMIPERGEGARLWDTEGNEYLDFAAGIAVSALGHAHPELCKVLAEQAGKFWHVSNLLTNKPAIDLAHKLCSLTFAERVFFANSGAEVNEAALKLARRVAIEKYGEGKTEIIAFDNSFHGRTFFTVCVGGQKKYSDGFGPRPGDITHLPFNDIDALKAAVSDRTCAIILEPVQGEGGVNPATAEFIEAARALCDEFKACLIFDEVQVGIGRSGYLFTYQKLDVTPDILTSAKGLGGGFPIGAMLTTSAIADSLTVGTHGSTFGGNPMACAVASKVLDIVSDPLLLNDVTRKSEVMKQALLSLNKEFDVFTEVRGDGLLLGCELSEKWRGRARDILSQCVNQGLLVLMAGTNVIRLAPPLIIDDADIHAGVARMAEAIRQLD